MNRELSFDLPLLDHITWQYDTAKNLRALTDAKIEWYKTNWGDFWEGWYTSVFNLKTANRFGCIVWAAILGVPINYIFTGDLPAFPLGFGQFNQNFNNANLYVGSLVAQELTVDEARRLLRVRYWAQVMSPTVVNINTMLQDVFSDLGLAYIEETVGGVGVLPFGFGQYRTNFQAPANFNGNALNVNIRPMHQKYIFTFSLSPAFKTRLQQYLPRGAAVNSVIVSP